DARLHSLWWIRYETGLEERPNYMAAFGVSRRSPEDYGQACLASLGWLLAFALKEGKEDAFVGEFQAANDKPVRDNTRALWNWYYLSILRQDGGQAYQAALALSRASAAEPAAVWAYLASLSSRTSEPVAGRRRPNQSDDAETVAPLAATELDFAIDCYRKLRERKPDWIDSRVLQ